ncbi:hypothetical protein Q31a_30930 [Aureliella helgolandensis]|uniref:Uncharacterized protein n=1 Tax=Aureliella helgolandensis TaxID=2527968 RepID=A0A518G862_9BACT|nr:hypothetical protein Q31a_30930 [Aureliella helgolandensis]
MTVAFKQCAPIAKEGLARVIEYATRERCQLVTTSQQLFLESAAGDFLLRERAGGKWKFVELKTEARFTGNLFVELHQDRASGLPGWLHTLNEGVCDELWYLFLDNSRLYRFNWPQLKKWIELNQGKFKQCLQRKRKTTHETVGLIVPVERICAARIPCRIVQLLPPPPVEADIRQVL